MGRLEALVGRLGHCEGPRSEYAKNIRFPKGMRQLLLLWALLARLLRASWDVLEASGAVLGASWASRSDLLASRGPLGPSGRRLAALGGSSGGLVARCSHGNERAGGAGQRGGEGRGRSTSFPRPRIWAHFLPGRPKTLGLVRKKEPHLGLDSSGGALIIASQGAKGPDTHLPLQARWRIYK